MTTSDVNTVCILDDSASIAQRVGGLLKSAGYRVRPFCHPDPFLLYARDHHPQAAIVDWGGSHARGLEIRARLREVSPMTSVIITLKIYQGGARSLLPGEKLVKLVKQICAGKSRRDFAESGVLYP